MDRVDVMDVNLKQRELIDSLRAQLHEVREIYTGMDGFVPKTAAEGYALRIILNMYDAALPQEYKL